MFQSWKLPMAEAVPEVDLARPGGEGVAEDVAGRAVAPVRVDHLDALVVLEVLVLAGALDAEAGLDGVGVQHLGEGVGEHQRGVVGEEVLADRIPQVADRLAPGVDQVDRGDVRLLAPRALEVREAERR